MSNSAACPGDDTLSRFQAGHVSGEEREEVARHVGGCSDCAMILAVSESRARAEQSGADAAPAIEAALTAGRVLAGRYSIVWLVGAGGMGEVYEAFDESLGEAVALKTVRATIAGNPRAVALLKSEVQLARRVTHRNVCRIFDFGVDGTGGGPDRAIPFLTMELLDGTTLARRLLAGGAMAPSEMVATARQIATGLLAAHGVGVIHKDLKSENVILAQAPGQPARAIVTDFGLAATRGLVDDAGGTSSSFSGTPGYVAPERLAGRPATEASDVFALGVVLEDLVSGTLPARRRRAAAGPGAAAALVALARRCQAIDPAARPALAEVVTALGGLEAPAVRARSRRARWALGAGVCAAAALALAFTRPRAAHPVVPAAFAPGRLITSAPPPAADETPLARVVEIVAREQRPPAPSRRRGQAPRAAARLAAPPSAVPAVAPLQAKAAPAPQLVEAPPADEPIRSLTSRPSSSVVDDDSPIEHLRR